jgi:myo-inositol-1(or 4)-monophosphatase
VPTESASTPASSGAATSSDPEPGHAGGAEPRFDNAATLEAVAAEVAVKATELIRRRRGQAEVVGTKTSHTDVVTQADLEVEDFIRAELLAATPGAGIKGEEQGSVGGSTSVEWVVDPIDGTVNFLYNLPVVSVSIAASIGGLVVAGAVADVFRGEVFSSAKGSGARLNGVTVRVSEATSIIDSLVATGFSYDASARAAEGGVFANLLPAVRDIRCFGSAALHLSWVSCGRLEAFYERGLNQWDVAAGALISSEAGARVELGSPENGDLVLAAAPGVFEAIRELIADS